MTGKKSNKSQKTAETIYKTAIELFKDRGFEKTTMREIARTAGVSLGLAYYYFKTKDDIVMQFYKSTQDLSYHACQEYFQQQDDLKERIRFILLQRIELFAPYQNFLHILANHAANPNHPLSPFSQQTKNLRKQAIEIFSLALQANQPTLPEDLQTVLPDLLWFYQMGIVYFWMVDVSPNKKRTIELVDKTIELLFLLLKLAKLPLTGKIRKGIIEIFLHIRNESESFN